MKNILLSILFSIACFSTTNASAKVILNEINPNTPDFIELYNLGSSPVNLQGYKLEVYSEYEPSFSFTFPLRTLDPGSEVLAVTDNGSPGVNEIYIGRNINWISTGSAAVVLRKPDNQIIDFFHLQGVVADVMDILPADINIHPTPLSPTADPTFSYQRTQVTSNGAEFFARDWKAQPVTQNSLNVNQVVYSESINPQIIINEVNPNTPDSIELSNFSCNPVNLQGYKLEVYSEYEPSFSFTFPLRTLDPGSEVIVVTDNGSPGVNGIYIGRNINWISTGSAAVVLRKPDNQIIDFFHLQGVVADVMDILPADINIHPTPLSPTADPTFSYQRTQVTSNGAEFFARDWMAQPVTQNSLNENQVVFPQDCKGSKFQLFLPAILHGAK